VIDEEKIKIMPYYMVYAADFKVLRDKLSNDDIVTLLNAISDLCLYGETDYTPATKFQEIWFGKFKDDFLKSLKKYKTSVENGKLGGRPKKTQEKPTGFVQDNPEHNPTETQGETIKENKIKENKRKEIVEVENFYGEYSNVYLTKKNYGKLLSMTLSQDLLNELIINLDENIGCGKEKPYDDNLKDAHFIRLKAYLKHRRQNPTVKTGEYNAYA
jgi:hypothetical protein